MTLLDNLSSFPLKISTLKVKYLTCRYLVSIALESGLKTSILNSLTAKFKLIDAFADLCIVIQDRRQARGAMDDNTPRPPPPQKK